MRSETGFRARKPVVSRGVGVLGWLFGLGWGWLGWWR